MTDLRFHKAGGETSEEPGLPSGRQRSRKKKKVFAKRTTGVETMPLVDKCLMDGDGWENKGHQNQNSHFSYCLNCWLIDFPTTVPFLFHLYFTFLRFCICLSNIHSPFVPPWFQRRPITPCHATYPSYVLCKQQPSNPTDLLFFPLFYICTHNNNNNEL